jgi:UDP-4-amino-4,6-dideoxy-N-acetyl-beta-L-altrosamine transaminase
MIPYGRQDISQNDIDTVIDVLKSDFLTQGPQIPKFEKAISDYTGVKYAVACNSATSALHIACLSLEVGPGDLVWTSAISFAASSNCALYCGAEVDFVDIDPDTFNMSVSSLEDKLKRAKKIPKVVIPVHMCGQSCDMQEIYKLSQEYGFKVIEDASHAIGAKYRDKLVGDCRYSDITVFSFHPVKIITTAEGGVACTNDEAIATKLELFRSHGITRREDLMVHESHGPWYYEQVELGYNYRMTDIHAALGVSQMQRLDEFIVERHKRVKIYNEELSNLSLKLPKQEDYAYSSFHLYVIRVEASKHKEIFESLRNDGIGVNLHYLPIYLHPYYEKLGFKKGYCKMAEEYYSQAISIPMYSHLSKEDQAEVIQKVKEAI